MKTKYSTKWFGILTASPAEFLVQQRLGQIRYLGRGKSAWVFPGIDRCWLVPMSLQSLSFCADQITVENQGVEVSGFLIWHIADVEQVCSKVNFDNPAEAVGEINRYLQEVIESAIRYQVANLSLEEVLRSRGSIVRASLPELGKVGHSWGLGMDAMEIKTVRVMSNQLFENMQARFRDTVRLESQRSAMETNEAISLQQAELQEQEARREAAFEKAEAERRNALAKEQILRDQENERFKAAQQTGTALAKLESSLILTKGKEANARESAGYQKELLQIEQAMAARELKLSRMRMLGRDCLDRIEDGIERRKIDTANSNNLTRLFIEALPTILSGVNIGKLNLGDPALVSAIQQVSGQLFRTQRHGGLYAPGDE